MFGGGVRSADESAGDDPMESDAATQVPGSSASGFGAAAAITAGAWKVAATVVAGIVNATAIALMTRAAATGRRPLLVFMNSLPFSGETSVTRGRGRHMGPDPSGFGCRSSDLLGVGSALSH